MSEVQSEMPKYECHKQVWALKIKQMQSILTEDDGGNIVQEIRMVPADRGFAPITLSKDFIKKHDPQEGGYYVVYKGGYKSYSPADAFEDGYTRVGL